MVRVLPKVWLPLVDLRAAPIQEGGLSISVHVSGVLVEPSSAGTTLNRKFGSPGLRRPWLSEFDFPTIGRFTDATLTMAFFMVVNVRHQREPNARKAVVTAF